MKRHFGDRCYRPKWSPAVTGKGSDVMMKIRQVYAGTGKAWARPVSALCCAGHAPSLTAAELPCDTDVQLLLGNIAYPVAA